MAQSQPRSAHPKRKRPAAWGTIRRRGSGKFVAFYRMEGRTTRAPRRFDSGAEAQARLATERAAHVSEQGSPHPESDSAPRSVESDRPMLAGRIVVWRVLWRHDEPRKA